MALKSVQHIHNIHAMSDIEKRRGGRVLMPLLSYGKIGQLFSSSELESS